MAESFNFKVDTSEFEKLNRHFSEKDWLKVKQRALKTAANNIKKDAKKNFKKSLPMATHQNKKYNDKMIDAIRTSKVKGYSDNLTIKVHTMGTKKSKSGTFRARFFEGGTEKREISYTDKLRRKYKNKPVGRIQPPLHFFRDAVGNLSAEKKDIDKFLTIEINKLNDKKY